MNHNMRENPLFERASTGKHDAKGKPIKEGDIIKVKHTYHTFADDEGEAEFFNATIRGAYGKHKEENWGGGFDFIYYRNYAVEYSIGEAAFIGRNGSVQHPLKQLTNYGRDAKIIGSIYENPECLKEETDK